MGKQNSTKTDAALKVLRSWKPGRTFRARIIILNGILALLITSLASHGSAATAQASGTLSIRIAPQAAMTITPLGSETHPESGDTIQLLKVELAIRMNPGTTASLWLQQAPESNEVEESNALSLSYLVGTPDTAVQSLTPINPSQIVFTARQNGRYYLTIGVKSADSFRTNSTFGKNIRIELKSSDQVLHLIKTL